MQDTRPRFQQPCSHRLAHSSGRRNISSLLIADMHPPKLASIFESHNNTAIISCSGAVRKSQYLCRTDQSAKGNQRQEVVLLRFGRQPWTANSRRITSQTYREVPGSFFPVNVLNLIHSGGLIYTILHRRLENMRENSLSACIQSISFLHKNNQKA